MRKIISRELVMFFVKEGTKRPLFYIPVRRRYDIDCLEVWFFLIAPIVLVYYIFINVLYSFWMELTHILDILMEWNGFTKR